MKIELKGLKVHADMSEETTCYSANVYVDGVKAFHAENRGYGGPDMYSAYEGRRELLENAEAWAKTLPAVACPDWLTNNGKPCDPMDCNLELYIGQLIEKEELRRRCLKGLLFRLPGDSELDERYIKQGGKKAKDSKEIRAWLAKNHPQAIILNDLVAA